MIITFGPGARSTDPDTSHDAVPNDIAKMAMLIQTLRVLRKLGGRAMGWQIDAASGFGSPHQRLKASLDTGFTVLDGKGRTPLKREANYHRITLLGMAFLSGLDAWQPEQKIVRQKSELRSYQRRVVDHLYECQEAFAVLKMGAGKTISTLTAIADLMGDKVIRHALIIAPKRVATIVWPAEVAAWEHTRHLAYAVLDGDPKQRHAKLMRVHERDITIIGIDNVQWLVEILKDVEADNPIWDCLVIDETSKLKDPKSIRAKALASISAKFKNRWGLTGTPAPNSLLDLFTPARIITDGRLWGKSFYSWQKQHFYPADRNGYTWKILPGHAKRILADAASISIALGENEMPDLPALSILIDEVELPADARREYRDMERKLFAEVGSKSIVAASQAVATGKLAQLANGFVYDEAGAAGTHVIHGEKQSWIEALVDELDDEPLIIVYEYKEDLAMLKRVFGDIPHLGAGVGDSRAQQHVEAWNRRELPIFALHPASGGHGLNLQAGGSRMAWLAPTWSAELWDQTIARIHRPGQAAHVMVHVCVATDTVDELKRMRVISKLGAQQAFERYLASSGAGIRRADSPVT